MFGTLTSPKSWTRIVIGVTGAILFLVLCIRLFAMTPMAAGMVESRLEAATYRGQTVEIEDLRGDVLGRMTVERMLIQDENGSWASAANVELRWSPLRALLGHLKIDAIEIESLAFQRRPNLAPATPQSETGASFFNRYQVQDFEVTSLSLAEGVAGPFQVYRVGANVDAKQRNGDLVLRLDPIDGRGDNVQADLAWGGAVPLQGRGTITGVPNGLIATLLQVPEGHGVTADIDASGALDDWQLVANGQVDDDKVLELKGEMRDGGGSFESALKLTQLGIFQPVERRLGERILVDARLDETNALSVMFEADAVAAQLNGVLARSKTSTNIEDLLLTVSGLDLERIADQPELRLTSLTARGLMEFRSDARVFTGEILAPRVQFGSYAASEVRSNGRHALQSDAIILENQIRFQTISGLSAALERVLRGPLSLSLDARANLANPGLDIAALNFRSERIQLDASGTLDVSGPLNVEGAMSLQSIAPIDELDGAWSLSGASLNTARLRVSGAALLNAPVQGFLAGETERSRIEIVAQRQDADLVLEAASVQNAKLEIDANGALRQGILDFDGRATAPSLSQGNVSADGMEASFRVSGAASSPRLVFDAKSDSLKIGDESLEDPTINGQILFRDGIDFDFRSDAVYLQAGLQGEAAGEYRDGTVLLRDLQLNWDKLTAVGNGAIVPSALDQSELSISYQGAAPIVGDVKGAISFVDKVLSADLNVSEFAAGPVSFDIASVRMSGDWPRFKGEASYDGRIRLLNEERSLSGRNGLGIHGVDRTLTVDGYAQIDRQKMTVASPIVFALEPRARVQGSLDAFGGAISFEGQSDGQQPARLSFENISMAEIGPLLLRPSLRGRMDGQGELSLIDDAVSGAFNVSVEGLARGAPNAPAADLTLEAQIEANEVTANLRARDSDDALDLIGAVSASLSHQGTIASIRPLSGGRVPIWLEGGGPIAPLWALIAPPDLRLEGDLQVDIGNGSGEAFRFAGSLNFENGAFEDGFTGLHLNDLSVEANLEPSGISVRQASASGVRGGRLQASGLYDFGGAGTVALELTRLKAFNRSDLDATVSGRANIERRDRRTHIEGRLSLDEARIDVSNLAGPGYTTIDVDFVGQADGERVDAPVREAISLDLGVSAQRRIFVTGPAIDSEWSLDARITGSPGQPIINGRASLVRGEADLLSRRFRLTEGLLRFVGDPRDSEISISAERANSDVSAWIEVSGKVLDPSISLRSDPTLPDDEIIARVLFGRSPTELSPLQAAQLAGAAAQLAGGEAFNLMNELEASVGLDRLDFGFDDSGAAILSTGKYLASDVYLELQSGGTGAPGVALEWTPLDNVSVDAEVDPELGPKVSIKWKRDFDDRQREDGSD